MEKQLHTQRNEFTQYRVCWLPPFLPLLCVIFCDNKAILHIQASAARELEAAKEEQSALIQEAVSVALANQRNEFEATLHSIEHRLSKRGSLPQGQVHFFFAPLLFFF